MTGLRVLVVEDDRDIRESLGELLADVGFTPMLAENGRVALELLGGASLPDVIVLDLAMPVMDGIEFRRRQLDHPRAARIPVVLVSADGDVGGKAAALGITHALRKPLDIEPFLALLRTLAG